MTISVRTTPLAMRACLRQNTSGLRPWARTVALLLSLTGASPTLGAQAVPSRPAVAPPVDSARAALQRAAFDEAIRWYDVALAADSLDRNALRESAEVLASRGQWRTALPRIERLVGLGVDDAHVNHRYGQWLIWDGRVTSGVTYLRKAITQAPDSLAWRLSLGQTLTWSPASRPDGVRVLRDLERQQPREVATRHALATALSWDPATRAEAIARFLVLIAEEPRSVPIRLDYADALSWNTGTRAEATRIYDDVRREDPRNTRAAMGRLNLLTWANQWPAALALTDTLLSLAPADRDLLLRRGTLLMQAGRPREAVVALRPFAEPSDSLANDRGLLEQYGYALLESGERGAARGIARRLAELPTPGTADWLRRDAAPGLGLDVSYTTNSFGLESFRLMATGSAAVMRRQRVTVSGGPVQYDSPVGGFAGTMYAVGLTGRGAAFAETRAEIGLEQFERAPSTWTARLEGARPLAKGGSLKVGVRRSPVEDTRRAARGDSVDGAFIGQVRANAIDVALALPELAGKLGARMTSTIAAYSGRGLRTNLRREGQLTLTYPIALGSRRLEAGAGVMGQSHAYDANRTDTAQDERGGYWSPTSFGNAIVTLGMSLPVTGRLQARVDVTGGRQFAGPLPTADALNIAGSSTVRWTGYRGWDVGGGFLYVDNLGGFQLRQWTASVRRAF